MFLFVKIKVEGNGGKVLLAMGFHGSRFKNSALEMYDGFHCQRSVGAVRFTFQVSRHERKTLRNMARAEEQAQSEKIQQDWSRLQVSQDLSSMRNFYKEQRIAMAQQLLARNAAQTNRRYVVEPPKVP